MNSFRSQSLLKRTAVAISCLMCQFLVSTVHADISSQIKGCSVEQGRFLATRIVMAGELFDLAAGQFESKMWPLLSMASRNFPVKCEELPSDVIAIAHPTYVGVNVDRLNDQIKLINNPPFQGDSLIRWQPKIDKYRYSLVSILMHEFFHVYDHLIERLPLERGKNKILTGAGIADLGVECGIHDLTLFAIKLATHAPAYKSFSAKYELASMDFLGTEQLNTYAGESCSKR